MTTKETKQAEPVFDCLINTIVLAMTDSLALIKEHRIHAVKIMRIYFKKFCYFLTL